MAVPDTCTLKVAMTERSADDFPADLEYDLAHEAVGPPAPRPDDQARCVPIMPADGGGDYSYDLAHDVPGR